MFQKLFWTYAQSYLFHMLDQSIQVYMHIAAFLDHMYHYFDRVECSPLKHKIHSSFCKMIKLDNIYYTPIPAIAYIRWGRHSKWCTAQLELLANVFEINKLSKTFGSNSMAVHWTNRRASYKRLHGLSILFKHGPVRAQMCLHTHLYVISPALWKSHFICILCIQLNTRSGVDPR